MATQPKKLTMVNDCSDSGCAASISCLFNMCPVPLVSCIVNVINIIGITHKAHHHQVKQSLMLHKDQMLLTMGITTFKLKPA